MSVMSNIAEGFERNGDREFAQFLAIAKGAAGKIRAQIYVGFDAGMLNRNEFDGLSMMAAEVSCLISGFMKYLQQSKQSGAKFK